MKLNPGGLGNHSKPAPQRAQGQPAVDNQRLTTVYWRPLPVCDIIKPAEKMLQRETPMKKLLFIISGILLGFCTAEAKTVDRILAQVNEDIITLSDLNRRMADIRQDLETKYSGEQLEQVMQKAEEQALDGLIQEKLLYQKAMELGYNADVDARISSYIQQLMKQHNIKDTEEMEAALAQQGTTLKDFRDQIRREMISRDLVQEFVGSRITILTPEIEKYYKDHAPDFTSPEEVTLSEIILPIGGDSKEAENRANDLYRRVQQGESFTTLASQYSKGPTANKGGNIGTYLLSKLNPDTVKAIANLKEGDISTPQKIDEGYVIYHIDSRKYSVLRPLDEVKDKIKNLLYERKFNPELERFMAQLKDDAYIQIFSEIK
jgi:peptidyl-prolyl cis-trans isomerase SurA